MRSTGKLLGGLTSMATGGLLLLTVASPAVAHSPGEEEGEEEVLSEQAQRDELADLLQSGAELVEWYGN